MDKLIAKIGATPAKIETVMEGEILDLNQLAKRCLQHESGAILISVPSNQPHVVPQTVIDNLV